MARQTAPLTDEQRDLALSGLTAARRSAWRKAPAVAALCGIGLDDVRQEAYLAACLAARSFPGAGDFGRYVATAARNRLRMLLRAAGEKCREGNPGPLPPDVERDRRREGTDELAGMRRRALRLLRRLSPAQALAMRLFLGGLNNVQAAARLDISEATVRTNLRRAAANLKRLAGERHTKKVAKQCGKSSCAGPTINPSSSGSAPAG